MNFQFIRTEIRGNQTVAYLLDLDRQELVIIPVRDYTYNGGGGGGSAGRMGGTGNGSFVSAPNNLGYYPVDPPMVEPRMMPPRTHGMVPEGFRTAPEQPVPRTDLPDKPAPLAPPPGLAGVFIPDGSPGAAVERRSV